MIGDDGSLSPPSFFSSTGARGDDNDTDEDDDDDKTDCKCV